jgi:hypothetical protein
LFLLVFGFFWPEGAHSLQLPVTEQSLTAKHRTKKCVKTGFSLLDTIPPPHTIYKKKRNHITLSPISPPQPSPRQEKRPSSTSEQEQEGRESSYPHLPPAHGTTSRTSPADRWSK